jgi:APA family basic amino acid/polyamine antiporter
VLYLLSSLALVRLKWTGEMRPARDKTWPLAILGSAAAIFSVWAIVGAGVKINLWGAGLLAMGAPVYFLVRHGKTEQPA